MLAKKYISIITIILYTLCGLTNNVQANSNPVITNTIPGDNEYQNFIPKNQNINQEKISIFAKKLQQRYEYLNAQSTSYETMNDKKLFTVFRLLYTLRKKVKYCVQETKHQMQQMKNILDNKAITEQIKTSSIQYKNLLTEQHTITQANLTCSMLNYRLDNEINTLAYALRHKNKSFLMIKDNALWDINLESKKNVLIKAVDKSMQSQLINTFCLYIAALFLIYFYIRLVKNQYPADKLLFNFQALLFLSSFVYYVTGNINRNLNQLTSIEFFDFLIVYGYICIIGRIFVIFFKNQAPVSSKKLTINLANKLITITSIICLIYAGIIITNYQNFPIAWLEIRNITLIILFNIVFLATIIYYLKYLIQDYPYLASMNNIIHLVFISTAIMAVIATMYGYRHLGVYLLPNVLSSIFIPILILDVNNFLKIIYNKFNNPKEKLSQKIHKYLKLPQNTNLIELFIVRIILSLYILIILPFAWLEMWGASPYFVEHIAMVISKEFVFLNIKIIIPLVIRGINIFCLILLSGRFFASYVVQQYSPHHDTYTKNIIHLCIRYTFFILGVFIGLMIMDVNLQGILVAVGTLSIGLGFGLQFFSKNFVSGIIIALTKPLKIGDYIETFGNRTLLFGYVEQIGILTTTIAVPDQSTLIIPNSYITNDAFKNYTSKKKTFSKVTITINVEDPTQRESSKQLLLEIAKTHKMISHRKDNEPEVYTNANGINLQCIIDDFRHKNVITGQIVDEITKTFAQQKITFQLVSAI